MLLEIGQKQNASEENAGPKSYGPYTIPENVDEIISGKKVKESSADKKDLN